MTSLTQRARASTTHALAGTGRTKKRWWRWLPAAATWWHASIKTKKTKETKKIKAPWEFQTKLLHYFFICNNKSSLHFTSAQTNRLTNAQRRGRYAQAGAKHAHAKGICIASTRPMALDVSLSLSHVMTAAPPPLSGAWQVLLGSCLVHQDLSVTFYTCRAPPLPRVVQKLCLLTVGAQPACLTVVARPCPSCGSLQRCHKWSKTALRSALAQQAGHASTVPRGLFIRFRACIRGLWQRPGSPTTPHCLDFWVSVCHAGT